MKPNVARIIVFLISIVAIGLAYYSRFQVQTLRYALLVGVALLVALVMFIKRKFVICPHCGRALSSFGFFETTCPYCGKDMK